MDQQAGTGPNAPIDRIVPLPRISDSEGIEFENRRLTLAYDDNPVPGAPPTVTVTGRFLPAPDSAVNVTVNAGERQVVPGVNGLMYRRVNGRLRDGIKLFARDR